MYTATNSSSSAFYPHYKSTARIGINNETPPITSAEIPDQDTAALTGDAFPQQMLYLTIPIGFGKGSNVKPQTAVFFPSSFDPAKPVDILIYFHGFLSSYPGNNRPIRDYLNYKDCDSRCVNLREEMERSGKNIILVAPTLDNKGHSGTLTHWGMLDVYLDKVKAGIAEHYLKKKFGADKMKKGRLIIAGHSAGGERIAELARQIKSADIKQKKALKLKQVAEQLKANGKPFAKKEAAAITALANAQLKYRADEFWGFDSMYGSGFTWIDTALRFPQIRLFMYYNPDGHKSKTPTFNMMEAAKKKSTLDSLVLINVKNDTERNSHFKIIRPSLRERLADLAAKGDGTDWEYEFENGVDSEVNLKSKKYIQWVQYALNNALGLRMEVNGKIGKSVKKAIADFRKQKGIASTGDFDNDTETALLGMDIIRPDFFLDSCVYSPVGQKDPSSNVQQEMVRIAEAEYVRWNNGQTKESDESIQPVLKAYWNETVHNLYGYTHKGAWSAVFISWVVKQAGGETMFPIDDAHSVYTFYSKLNRTRNGLFFRAYRTSEVRPELGDIIVRARDNSGASYDKLSPEVMFSHGQIVVEILPGKIKVIGGNESQTKKGPGVTVNRHEALLSRDGFLHCSTSYFAVIRLDRLGAAPLAKKNYAPMHYPKWKDLEFEDTPGTGQPLELKLWDSVRAHLGKCPVNPNDMVSLISSDYALKALKGKLAGFFQNEINFLKNFTFNIDASLLISVKRILEQIELNFIHDPEASTLDLLPAPTGTEYRNFNWMHDDYPGNKNKKTHRHGKNQKKSRKMHRELILLRPERRPNKDETKVMSPEQFCSNKKYIVKLCNNGTSLMSYAKQSFDTMQQAAKKDNVDLSIHNDFRYSECEKGTVKRTTKNDNTEAVGTFSSHKMGLAVDLNLSFDNKVFSEVTTRPFKQVIEMRTSPSHKWMFLKGALFGWYPLMPEPWHWEYNPVGFREIFWNDLNASKPKKKKKTKELEFSSRSILDELMMELEQEQEFKVDSVDVAFLTGKAKAKTLSKIFIDVPDEFIVDDKKKERIRLLEEVLVQYIKMFKEAKKSNIDLPIVSGYRSFIHQKSIWENKWNGKRDVIVNGKKIRLTSKMPEKEKALAIMTESSMPATSRHHWGTDMDLISTDSSYFETDDGKKQYDWLVKNASTFGFCQPFSQKFSSYQPLTQKFGPYQTFAQQFPPQTTTDSVVFIGRTKGYNEEKWHWSYLPKSKPLLELYMKNVKLKDITGFVGSNVAVTLDVINEFVNGVGFYCQ